MFLTPDELVALTGKRRHSAQARVLAELRITPLVRPGGSLVVLRSAVEARQTAPEPTRPQVRRTNHGQTAKA